LLTGNGVISQLLADIAIRKASIRNRCFHATSQPHKYEDWIDLWYFDDGNKLGMAAN
jgi:hypothetical protein